MIVGFALKEIRRRKTRSILNILGYFIAVGFFIIMISLAQGYNIVASGDLRGIGTHFVSYIPASVVCPCEFREVGPFFKGVYTPTYSSSVVEQIKVLEGVEDAAPFLMFRLDNLTIAGLEIGSLATNAVSVGPEMIIEGRYLQETDTDGLLLDEIYARLLNLGAGDQINFFDRSFNVVGVVNPAVYSKPAGDANMYALLGVVQQIARSYGEIYGFSVSEINAILVEISAVGDVQYLENTKSSVLETLQFEVGAQGSIAGYQCDIEARKVVSLTENSAWISSIILFVAVILYSARGQFSSIIERKEEIGLLKALGWTDSEITKQILAESLLQGIIGGILGLTIGYLVVILIPLFGFVSLQNLVFLVSPQLLILGLLSSIGAGAIAGIIPARHVAKLQPSQALRHF